jgi:DNA polymerase-3 subunit beta
MQISVHREPFLAAYLLAAGVAPSRTPKPVLQNVKLTVGLVGAFLSATDLEVGVRLAVSGVGSDNPGSVLLSPRIGQILRLSPDAMLTFTADADQFVVRGQRSEFTLPTENPDLFPEVAGFEADGWFTLESRELRKAIRRTIFATDVDSTKYALGGVLLEPTESGLVWAATDGRRLARYVTSLTAISDAAPTGTAVVPVKALKLAERLLDDSEAPVEISFSKSAFMLRTSEGDTLSSRLVEGRFPRYQDVFPSGVPHVATIAAGAFAQSVEQASIVTSEESRGVDFLFAPDGLNLSGMSADVGKSTVDLPISYSGPALTLAIDARYLRDFLKTLEPSDDVRIEIIDDKNGVVFKHDEGYTYVVMPLVRDANKGKAA